MINKSTIIRNENRDIRDIKLSVRLTPEEAEWLKEAAWRCKTTQAQFVRERVFQAEMPQLPVEVSDLLRTLQMEINKIGVNVNQLARSCNTKGYATGYEKKKLDSDMETMRDFCEQIYEAILKVVTDGNYKTASY